MSVRRMGVQVAHYYQNSPLINRQAHFFALGFTAKREAYSKVRSTAHVSESHSWVDLYSLRLAAASLDTAATAEDSAS